jgi:hypothetical protein
MRYAASVFTLLIVVGLTAGAFGADKKAVKEVKSLANEVQQKIISRTDAAVKVQAHECWLHIEFEDNNVAFDVPMQGTKVAGTDLDDGIVVQNRYMIRTFSGREPESFERLLLKFGRYNTGAVMQSFENAIKACGTQQARAASVPRT